MVRECSMRLPGHCYRFVKVIWVVAKWLLVGLGNKYRFLDINRFSFLRTDIDS